MHFDWQNTTALTLVASAAGYLSWQAWRVLSARRQGGCGSCSKCPATAPGSEEPSLVPLVAIRLERPAPASKDESTGS
jgi:hypothetical protein